MPVSKEELQELLFAQIRNGRPLATASELLRNMLPQDAALVDEAVQGIRAQIGAVEVLRRPRTLRASNRVAWYPGPRDGDTFWPALRSYLATARRWSDATLEALDRASSRIVGELDFPGTPSFQTRGLVLGHVQSGKTANFTAVISKAADAGFKLFIVLSGITNSLRSQTQERLQRELVDLNRSRWLTWTGPDEDLGDIPFNIDALLAEHGLHRHVAVVKKNAARLRRLLVKLQEASEPVKNACPVLIIDDECDQASVNANAAGGDPSIINGLMRSILEQLPKVAYVGYTATPFANVFIDPTLEQDLYPRDFIVDLERPANYFGAERLFGRDPLESDAGDVEDDGLDMIRSIPTEEIPLLQPASRQDRDSFVPSVTTSLERALRYFWMATAARHARGDSGQHSSMLVHTTAYADPHLEFEAPLTTYREAIAHRLADVEDPLHQELRELWEAEQERLPPEQVDREGVPFHALAEHLLAVVRGTEIVIENSRSDRRIDYSEPGRIYVVVGGNVLARGLTLEGLVVSYFLRTASAYDSLLQMGRWFGYRPNYEDLPRIWMSDEMRGYFKDLATVEQEIRNDIRRYDLEGVTPLDFGIRIRTHPHLAITARNKMLAAVPTRVSFEGRLVQTILFHVKDVAWLRTNWEAGCQLIQDASSAGRSRIDSARWVFHDVPVERILAFLERYQVHERAEEIRLERVVSYIERNNAGEDPLRFWNVAVIGSDQMTYGPAPLGVDRRIGLIGRSRFVAAGGESRVDADIKSLVSAADIIVDFEPPTRASAFSGRGEMHDARAPGGRCERPLLLLYPIAMNSRPLGKASRRAPLDADGHVMGLALVFPRSNRDTPARYMTVALPEHEWEEPEVPVGDEG